MVETASELKKLSFEERFERLRNIVERLSDGDLPLEQLESSFKEGMSLCELCMCDLDRVEQGVQVLVKDAERRFATVDFETEEDFEE